MKMKRPIFFIALLLLAFVVLTAPAYSISLMADDVINPNGVIQNDSEKIDRADATTVNWLTIYRIANSTLTGTLSQTEIAHYGYNYPNPFNSVSDNTSVSWRIKMSSLNNDVTGQNEASKGEDNYTNPLVSEVTIAKKTNVDGVAKMTTGVVQNYPNPFNDSNKSTTAQKNEVAEDKNTGANPPFNCVEGNSGEMMTYLTQWKPEAENQATDYAAVLTKYEASLSVEIVANSDVSSEISQTAASYYAAVVHTATNLVAISPWTNGSATSITQADGSLAISGNNGSGTMITLNDAVTCRGAPLENNSSSNANVVGTKKKAEENRTVATRYC